MTKPRDDVDPAANGGDAVDRTVAIDDNTHEIQPLGPHTTASGVKTQTRGRPFQTGQSGNPAGRPRGSRNRATRLADVLADGEAEALIRRAVEKARDGDVTMLKSLMALLLAPPGREQFVALDLPPIATAADGVRALGLVVGAATRGEIALEEARIVCDMIERQIRCAGEPELEQRLASIEESLRQLR